MTRTHTSELVTAEVTGLAKWLPYLRRAAAEVLPTAKAQRWDPAEVLRVLLEEEAAGRDAATIRNRRRRANFPTARVSTPGGLTPPPSARQLSRRCAPLEWIRWAKNLAVFGPPARSLARAYQPYGRSTRKRLLWCRRLRRLTFSRGPSRVPLNRPVGRVRSQEWTFRYQKSYR